VAQVNEALFWTRPKGLTDYFRQTQLMTSRCDFS